MSKIVVGSSVIASLAIEPLNFVREIVAMAQGHE
jgi:hypothetical protein